MDDQIAHLRFTYRPLGDDPSTAAAVAARFDRIARSELPDRYGGALGVAFGPAPDVYILRDVRASGIITSHASLTDSAVADVLARRMAAAVMRAIRDDTGDGSNLIRFASEQEFVARFVHALADGSAWTQWYFFPFRSVRDLPVAAAIRRVFLEHRATLPRVLARLHRTGGLERVLGVLGSQALDDLWQRDAGDADERSPDPFRPLFAAAVTLLERLRLWTGSPPSRAELERLFEMYMQASPAAPAWSDPRSLTLVVLEIVRYLAMGGAVDALSGQGRSEEDDLREAVRDLDWLDRDYLCAQLRHTVAAGARSRSLPAPRPLTPRQQEIAAHLLQVLPALTPELDSSNPGASINGVRLFAALVDRVAAAADDGFARAAIDSVLLAWTRVAGGNSHAILDHLRRGRIDDAVIAGASGDSAAARALRLMVAMFGARGAADALHGLLARASGAPHPKPAAAPSSAPAGDKEARPIAVPTRCAGVFLLARAALDARLQGLISVVAGRSARSPTLEIMLAALAMRWGGAESVHDDGRLDSGVLTFAGLDPRFTLTTLREQWTAVDDAALIAVQEEMLATLAGLRVVTGGVLELHVVHGRDGLTALFGGPDSGDIWPLAAIVDDTTTEATMRRWADLWNDVMGQPPLVVFGEKGSDALVATVDALSAAQLGLPSVDLMVTSAAASLLRLWARWLGHFSESTVPYLLDRFVRREGYIDATGADVIVSLDPRPLDVVLEMSGYTDVIPAVSWLGDRRLRFARAAAGE